jgi:hypothetical protein
MSLYAASIPQFKKMLLNLDRWLAKAVDPAQKKTVDAAALLEMRLAPDQFNFTRQVQSACDAAKSGAARLTGQQPPSHPDTEQSVQELRARIQTCIAYLDTFKASDFADAASRRIALPFMPGKLILGSDYLTEFALPNFYFHVTTAYAILRHKGVELGKTDFLGSINFFDA